ncbi:MAG: hypothetical protein HEQ39_09585 [Rhizobacter sp.]
MEEIQKLRTELAELRDATKHLLAMTTAVLSVSPNSATALMGFMANVGQANAAKERGEAFDDISIGILLALSSVALKHHPQDPEVRDAYNGLRPGSRH